MLRIRQLAICFILIVFSVSASARDQPIDSPIKDILTQGRRVAGEELYTLPFLEKFYESHEYKTAWVRGGGLTSQAKDLIRVLNASSKEGLSPRLYHTERIEELIAKGENSLEIELLLSDAFFSLAFHYSYGAVDPDTGEFKWFEHHAYGKLRIALETAVNTSDVEGPLNALLPKNSAYLELKKALAQYYEERATARWPKIQSLPKGRKIYEGDEDQRIPAIRDRLGVEKRVSEKINPNIYDEALKEAVIKFQRENGLLDDGVIGFRTVNAMNVPLEDRICQIKINLDRLRALQNIWDQKERVVVNIPAFWLETYENGNLVLDMKVIDGMVKRKTPTLSSEIVHLIFSPKWYVPDTILFEDKLPHIIKDPSWLRRHGMRVYEKGGKQVDPESIDWTQFQSKHIPYRVVQDSGDANALGRVKFIFPNRYDVFLHDTPQKELFGNAQRAFSSGCIRIEKPVDLVLLLLKDKPEWNAEKIEDAMGRNYEQVVPLTKPMPIHIIYVTAWVDKSGTLNFRDDIYGFDGPYKKLLCD